VSDPRPVRRRSALIQERSRETRKRLVRSALALWTERGFEHGIEDTTVDEIVRAAGVTKGTFYFHFGHKEDILLEMGWETAAVVNDEVRRSLKRDRELADAISRVIAVLVRHVQAASPAAVGRAVAEFRSSRAACSAEVGRAGMGEGFAALFARAIERGEIAPEVTPDELSQMLQALIMDSLLDWSRGGGDLGPALKCRSDLLLRGLNSRCTA